jgi:hypothetical protein
VSAALTFHTTFPFGEVIVKPTSAGLDPRTIIAAATW